MKVTDRARGDLIDFITNRGWTLAGTGTIGELWESSSGRQVGVPYSVEADSLDWRAILERVAADSKLSVNTLSGLIAGFWADTFAFRASSDVYIRETIPARAGADMFMNIWKLLRSAATTSRTPKAQIQGNWSKVGDAAIENARFAHTEKGSYILPLIVPLPRPLPGDPNGTMLDIGGHASYHESDARRATRTLAEALAAVDAGLVQPEHEPRPSIVADLVHLGVSRELIMGVHDIIRHKSVAQLDVNIGWAEQVPGLSLAPHSIVIPAEASYRLSKVAPLFKSTRKQETETLTGPIYKMSDREGDEFGIATMEVPRNGRTSMIDVFLPRKSLVQAHDWFKDHKAILVEGRVASSSRGLVVRSPSRFELLGSTMFFESHAEKA